jgi:hypothetical protein
MIIRLCFPFYKDCPIYDKLLKEVKTYNGEHTFIFRKAQGTIVHDVRNVLIAESLRIGKDWILPQFDFAVLIDSDMDYTLQDIIYLCELDKDIAGLPYKLRGRELFYNAGFILENGFDHLPIETTGLMEVHGQGNGCKAIKRKVFENLKPFWFYPIQHTFKDGSIDSLVEDWAFDFKARKAGFRVWCDFNRPVNHNLKQEPKMNENILKGQLQSQKMMTSLSLYIGQLVENFEKVSLENQNLKNEIEKLKGVTKSSVGGSRKTESPEL